MDANLKHAHNRSPRPDAALSAGASIFLLSAALVWAYRDALGAAARRWSVDPLYQHGYVIPVLALLFLFWRRDLFAPRSDRANWFGIGVIALGLGLWALGTVTNVWITLAAVPPILLGLRSLAPGFETPWWSLALLGTGLALRFAGDYFFVDAIAMVSFIPALAGVFAVVGGWRALQWAWPALAFLVFMFPLPYRLETALQQPLRQIGTLASVYTIQTFGIHAVPMGNVILLNDAPPLGVEEACSGLAMLMVFAALTTTFAFLMQRPLWERAIIVASAVPIALASNILRISGLASLYALGYRDAADWIHENDHAASFLMMVPALLMLWAESEFLSRLFIAEEERPVLVGLAEEVPKAPAAKKKRRARGIEQRREPAVAAAGTGLSAEK